MEEIAKLEEASKLQVTILSLDKQLNSLTEELAVAKEANNVLGEQLAHNADVSEKFEILCKDHDTLVEKYKALISELATTKKELTERVSSVSKSDAVTLEVHRARMEAQIRKNYDDKLAEALADLQKLTARDTLRSALKKNIS